MEENEFQFPPCVDVNGEFSDVFEERVNFVVKKSAKLAAQLSS
jgi:hypothetical protein